MSDFGATMDWARLRAFLPFDLDGLAFEKGLLTRRRGVSCGEDLARLLLMLALPGATCERVSRWAGERGLARMGTTAVFARASRAEPFLSSLLATALSHAAAPQPGFLGYRLLAVDATALCGPGAAGTDLRLHAVYDLASGTLASFDLTDARGGETLARHAPPRGSLLLADRGYGHARGLAWALDAGARFLVRFEFASLRLLDERLRAVGERNAEGRAVWLLTDLPPEELPRGGARPLYARRWQVELFFKRLKSLLDLDELPTRDGPTARPWVLAKLALATLAVLSTDERFSPWGLPASQEPVEAVRRGGLAPTPGPPRRAGAPARPRKATTRAEGAVATRLLEA